MYHANTNQKKVGLAINIRKSRFQSKEQYQEQKGHFRMIKRQLH